MSHIFPRHTRISLPTVSGGDGVYLIDTNGKRYLDGSSGAAVSCLGHSNAAVAQAILQQTDSIAFAHTSFFTSAPAEALADRLATLAPGEINRVYFVSGGSEAVEAALKLARQYHVERGDTNRRHIIGRWQSYHGNTLGALAVGGNKWRRKTYAPLLFDNAHHIAPCHYWRFAEDEETAAEYGKRTANALEEKILELGAETVAAFIAETVVGATMGAVAAVDGYFRRIRDICTRYGVLLILDEVMCGTGRTGTFFACEQEKIVPDILCIAKGIGGGAQALGAMLCDKKIYDTIADNSGFFQHGHTYIGHPTACAAGVAVLQEFDRQNLLTRVSDKGRVLEQTLRDRFADHPHIGNIRGRGLFWGMEFVADRNTNQPFAPDKQIHAKIKQTAFAHGLMVYAMGGTVDGINGDHILLAPPFIIEDTHIAELADKLSATLDDVF